MTDVRPKGVFTMYHRDAFGRLVWSVDFPNGTTYEGVNYALDGAFRGASRSASWFLRLIDDSGFSALSANDTLASHPGWNEFSGVYGGLGGTWSPIAANAGLMAYSPITTVLIASAGTIRGAFLANVQAVGGTGGVLYAAGVGDAGLPVLAGGTVSIGYKTKLVG